MKDMSRGNRLYQVKLTSVNKPKLRKFINEPNQISSRI